jgi:hypothetical protein
MTLKIAHPVVLPATTYDENFLWSFVMTQDASGKKFVEAVVQASAPTGGDYVFTGEKYTIQISDFDAWAFALVATQLGSAEAALAAYVAAKNASNAMNLLQCMAGFQAGVGIISDAKNVFQMQAVV